MEFSDDMTEQFAWGIEWPKKNRLDGKRCPLQGGGLIARPRPFQGYTMMSFRTRDHAREYVKRNYSWMRERKDLRAEPHGWRMPRPVKIKITVQKV